MELLKKLVEKHGVGESQHLDPSSIEHTIVSSGTCRLNNTSVYRLSLLIITAMILSGKWAKIAAEIPNRVDSQCLNKWKWMTQQAQVGSSS